MVSEVSSAKPTERTSKRSSARPPRMASSRMPAASTIDAGPAVGPSVSPSQSVARPPSSAARSRARSDRPGPGRRAGRPAPAPGSRRCGSPPRPGRRARRRRWACPTKMAKGRATAPEAAATSDVATIGSTLSLRSAFQPAWKAAAVKHGKKDEEVHGGRCPDRRTAIHSCRRRATYHGGLRRVSSADRHIHRTPRLSRNRPALRLIAPQRCSAATLPLFD